eukprot:8928593-Pyramimonas_sp.AAC.1
MTAQSPRAPPLAPATDVKDVETPGETAERSIRENCPEGRLTLISKRQKSKFPKRPKEGYPGEEEYLWPIHKEYQHIQNLPMKDAKTGEVARRDVLCPFTVAGRQQQTSPGHDAVKRMPRRRGASC